jgi:hypothetical protein
MLIPIFDLASCTDGVGRCYAAAKTAFLTAWDNAIVRKNAFG